MSDGGAGALVQVVGGLAKHKAGRVVLMVGAAYLALVGLGTRDQELWLIVLAVIAVVCAAAGLRAWLKRRAEQAATSSLLLILGVVVMMVVGAVAGIVLLFRRKKKEPETLSLPPVAELEALAQAEAREAA